jgi:hypothetical protein
MDADEQLEQRHRRGIGRVVTFQAEVRQVLRQP